jgi:WD40 repeat protein
VFHTHAQQDMQVVAQLGQVSRIDGVQISDDNQTLVTYYHHRIVFWDVKTGLEFNSIYVPETILELRLLNNRTIIFGTKEGSVQIWEIYSGTMLNEFSFQGTVDDLLVDPNDPSIVFIASDNLYQYDFVSNDTLKILNDDVFKLHWNDKVGQFQFLTEAGYLVTLKGNLEVKNKLPVKKLRKNLFKNRGHFIKGSHTADYYTFSDEFNLLVYTTLGVISAIDIETGKLIHRETSYYTFDYFTAIEIDELNNKIYAGNESQLFCSYELSDKVKMSNFFSTIIGEPHKSAIVDITISKDGKYIVTASSDFSAILWDARSMRQIKRFYSKTFQTNTVEYYSSGNEFVFGDDIGAIHKVDLTGSKAIHSSKRISFRKIVDLELYDDSILYVGGVRKFGLSMNWDDEFPNRIGSNGQFVKTIKSPKKGDQRWTETKFKLSPQNNYLLYMNTKKAWQPFIVDLNSGKKMNLTDYSDATTHDKSKSLHYWDMAISPNGEYLIQANKQIYSGSNEKLFKVYQGHLGLLKLNDAKYAFEKYLVPENGNCYMKVDWVDNENILGVRFEKQLDYINIHTNKLKTIDTLVEFFSFDIKFKRLFYSIGDTLYVSDSPLFELTQKVHIGCNANDVKIHPQGEKYLVCGGDGSVQLRDLHTNELILKYYAININHYIMLTADNYYMADQEGLQGIGFRVGDKIFPPEQFDLKFNRPDIVLKTLGSKDSALIVAYYLAYQKRLKKMGFVEEMVSEDFHVPDITISNRSEIPAITEKGKVDVHIAASDAKYNLNRINVWVNDVAIYGTKGIALIEKNTKEFADVLTIDLARGNNKIQVSVLNSAGAESYREMFEIECSYGKEIPDLYIVTIGVSKFKDHRFNLTYAAKDAEDMVKAFGEQNYFGQVHHKTLTDKDVIKENIQELKNFLSKADINDQVIVFIAGHGVLDENFDYYFASYDMDFTNPSERGIAYEELENLLDGIKPLKKLLLMDTCHSGEVDKDDIQISTSEDEEEDSDIVFRYVGTSFENKENRLGLQNTNELMKSLFTDLRKGTGSTVISSAGGVEFAMESEKWQNGLFTYCLISGLTELKADLNNDKEISVSELQNYIRIEVSTLSDGRQTPTSRIVNNTLNYRIW